MRVETDRICGGITVTVINDNDTEHQWFFTEEAEKDNEVLCTLTLPELHNVLNQLVIRLESTDAPHEKEGIEKVFRKFIVEIEERSQNLEEKNTRRNKLIRHLREEISRLKKISHVD